MCWAATADADAKSMFRPRSPGYRIQVPTISKSQGSTAAKRSSLRAEQYRATAGNMNIATALVRFLNTSVLRLAAEMRLS
jgi:hypothetical protein